MNIHYIKNDDMTITVTFSQEDFEEHFCFCSDCDEFLFIDDATRIDGKYYCSDCLTTCDCCGQVIPRQEAYQTEDSSYDYCRSCFETHTCRCDDCGNRFRYEDSLTETDSGWYCENCYDDHRPMIQDYHTQKEYGSIRFCGDESRSDSVYMGFELEVDSNHRFDRERVATELQRRFDNFFAYERDGSLNNGFEIISQPASLSYHLGMMSQYSDAFSYMADNGVSSHDAGTCGLHVHLDRMYFGKQEDCAIAKLLYVFEKYHKELLVFSRRTEEQCTSWCRSRKKHYNNEAGWIEKSLVESKYGYNYQNRYFSVNLTNNNTIELRLFRGSLNPETFEATLCFSARLAELCKNTKAVELSKMTFEDLLGSDKVILSYWNRISR